MIYKIAMEILLDKEAKKKQKASIKKVRKQAKYRTFKNKPENPTTLEPEVTVPKKTTNPTVSNKTETAETAETAEKTIDKAKNLLKGKGGRYGLYTLGAGLGLAGGYTLYKNLKRN